MKSLLLVLFYLAAIGFVSGQNSITGQILHKDTSEGLPFANIYFPELEIGTTSDENGYFTLTNLPGGNYKILVSFIGFKTESLVVYIPQDDELIVRLNPSAIEMDVVIVSTPFHKLQRDNVMKVEQKTISELQSNGAQTLADGISTIAGVESITTGTGIGKPVIRGLSGNRVLVYTQGIRLENQQYGEEHGLGVSDSGIESIEVIKGPASLLYGSDALGGVLYINPEKFAIPEETVADISYRYFSNTRGHSSNVGVKSSSKHFKYLIRGSIASYADYKNDRYRVTNSRFKENDLKTGIGFQKKRFKTDLRYNYNASELGIPETISVQNTSRSPLEPFQDLENHIISSKSRVFFKNSSLDLNLGYIFNDRKEFEEPGEDNGTSPALHMKLKTFSYDIKYNLPELGKIESIIGVQGLIQNNTNFGNEVLIPDARITDIGVFATSHIHFESLDLQIGTRYDNRKIDVQNDFNRNFNSFTIAAGGRLDLSKTLVGRINLASGFRAPNLAELASDGVHEGTNRYEIGNPDLDNEQNFQFDLALEFQTDHIELFVNGFYNHIKDFIFVSPNGNFMDDNPVYLFVQDDADLYGGEFGFHWHPHPLDWLHLESSFEMVRGKQENGNPLPLIPAHSIKNKLRFELKNKTFDQLEGFVALSHTLDQTRVSDFETITGGYSLLNAGISGEFKLFNNSCVLNITATNITNKVYLHHLSRLKIDGISNMGTNIIMGIRYSL